MYRAVKLRERIHDLESKLDSEDADVLETKLAELIGLNNNIATSVPYPPRSTVEASTEEDQALYMQVLKNLRAELQQSIGEIYRLSGRIVERTQQLPTIQHGVLLSVAPPILANLAAYMINEAPRNFPQGLLSLETITAGMLIAMIVLVVAIGWRSEDMRKDVCNMLFERARRVYTVLGYREASEVPSFREFCSGARLDARGAFLASLLRLLSR
ncbi:hypothetical protein PABY_21630 [Pyrodictium abyssi]|uniref:Uncharacterized protein n=2 Tax=Pyrodictium abyssi TaxID=54256 RepID=A0ABN6ZVS8_9CREN|nr:hypothetical protein PABY_21630 [Pyrodictium abyssi]